MKIYNPTAAFLLTLLCGSVSAQITYEDMEQLTVNANVTSVITASESVRLVDVSTKMIAADQPLENVVRIKPVDDVHPDGECVGILTIITERYRVQYALIYTQNLTEAVTDKEVEPSERLPYNNPDITLSTEEMYRYSRRIFMSPPLYRDISTKMHRMKMRLNNVYAVSDYFFIDFSVENNTNIRFDIDQLRVKLSDKKVVKATNSQMLEITPALIFDPRSSFKHGYRNVIVIRKMTFPNDKVLTIELTEKQISGRTIYLDIDYADILEADSYNNLVK